MGTDLHVLMVAAENDALPGFKVGGIGDVLRDVPPVLADKGCHVTVMTPAYGSLTKGLESRSVGAVEVGFRGLVQLVGVYEVKPRCPYPGVRHVVVDHPLFAAGGTIYFNDPPEAPFATDANKFALFDVAVAEAVVRGMLGKLDVLHLHDWHTTFLLVLRRFHPAFQVLQNIRCVYSLHNLSLQGIRPFGGNPSSLESWYPGLSYDGLLLADPRWPNCINPMAAGIRLADAVHTVSPSYAQEILQPSAVESKGYYGGEGLEADLNQAYEEGRLVGILNGCEYPDRADQQKLSFPKLLKLARREILRWVGTSASLETAHYVALTRLDEWASLKRGVVVTSIGRVTGQKLRLLREPYEADRVALEGLIKTLGNRGFFLLLGNGDPEYERFLTEVSARFDRFVFMKGYSEVLARALYTCGDLFLMPSSYEPCGISQMLAMRAGQPCLVHSVGGLRDTVTDGVNGFAFSGDSLAQQALELVKRFESALKLKEEEPQHWKEICRQAAAMRFSWSDSVEAYLNKLYCADGV